MDFTTLLAVEATLVPRPTRTRSTGFSTHVTAVSEEVARFGYPEEGALVVTVPVMSIDDLTSAEYIALLGGGS